MSSRSRWAAVERYATDLLVGRDKALTGALKTTARAGMPAIHMPPPEAKLLQMLARTVGAKRILEIGTLGGYSAIWMARALPPNGRLVSLEVDPRHADVARANIARARLGGRVEIRVGPALQLLPALKREGGRPFDFVFIDADKVNTPAYFKWAVKLSRPGALIVADNVVRDGKVLNAKSRDQSVRGVRKLNALVARMPRVSATILQTVGARGYDGFLVARVE